MSHAPDAQPVERDADTPERRPMDASEPLCDAPERSAMHAFMGRVQGSGS